MLSTPDRLRRRRLPPLGAVRAFEAAVRHMNFSEAARELCVTTSAISQQIKSLEEYLGVSLFRRDPSQGISLTAAGHVCAPSLHTIFDSLSHAFDQVHVEPEKHTVTIIVPPSLLATWFPERLLPFQESFPNIELRLWFNPGLLQARNDPGHDLAIYFGNGPFNDVRVDPMMSDAVFPVCSPALLARTPISCASDLLLHCLIHDDTMLRNRESQALALPDWSVWLAHAGVIGAHGSRSLRVQMTNNVMAAAACGAGVALARSCIAESYLRQGTLVRPLAIDYPRRFPYYLVCGPNALGNQSVVQVHAWLLKEGSNTP